MERDDIIRMALKAGFLDRKESCPLSGESTFDEEICVGEYPVGEIVERFAALVAAEVHKTYSPIGTVAGGAAERTFMHPSVRFILPTGLQLYARIEVREEDKV